MNAEVNVIGVGMTRFRTPKQGAPYPQMAREAIVEALHDAGVATKTSIRRSPATSTATVAAVTVRSTRSA